MTSNGRTTRMVLMDQEAETLTGQEQYPIIGSMIEEDKVREIFSQYTGLTKHWHCIEKAHIAKRTIGGNNSVVVVGSLMVFRTDFEGSYGYYFNPPFELHAWVGVLGKGIFDAALPGVIEKGLVTEDEFGPILVERKPVILNGKPEIWMKYIAQEIIG